MSSTYEAADFGDARRFVRLTQKATIPKESASRMPVFAALKQGKLGY